MGTVRWNCNKTQKRVLMNNGTERTIPAEEDFFAKMKAMAISTDASNDASEESVDALDAMKKYIKELDQS